MKHLFRILAILILLGPSVTHVHAQHSSKSKGFDYAKHNQMNKKAGRWSKKRIKASDGDQTNVQCSVRKSRRHRRK